MDRISLSSSVSSTLFTFLRVVAHFQLYDLIIPFGETLRRISIDFQRTFYSTHQGGWICIMVPISTSGFSAISPENKIFQIQLVSWKSGVRTVHLASLREKSISKPNILITITLGFSGIEKRTRCL